MLLLAAVAMSVGWGLRGYIGGGPLGAMIPGALVALVLCLCLRRSGAGAARIAAFGAIGIGLGGEMTYGQTVGFLSKPETFWWGVFGLTVKGAIWGFSGGAILGLALDPNRVPFRRLALALAALIAGVQLGWVTINQPKLIYFSNPVDKPRAEIWAGLLLGAVFFLLTLAPGRWTRVSLPFAAWGALGGGLGFGLGGILMTLGRNLPVEQRYFGWWKLMEFTFGFLFGLALAWAAKRQRSLLIEAPAESTPSLSRFWSVAAAMGLSLATIYLEEGLGLRYSYMVIGAVLLLLVDRFPELAASTAIIVTLTAAAFDLGEVETIRQPLALAVAGAAVLSFLPLNLTTLLWGGVVISWIKSFAQTSFRAWPEPAHLIVEILFTLGAVIIQRLAARAAQTETPPSIP